MCYVLTKTSHSTAYPEMANTVLKGLLRPPFVINGSDWQISLELTHKTAFLVLLVYGVRGSELVALSRALQSNFRLSPFGCPSGPNETGTQVFLPPNSTLDVIPQSIQFPGIAYLFLYELEWLLCTIWALALCDWHPGFDWPGFFWEVILPT